MAENGKSSGTVLDDGKVRYPVLDAAQEASEEGLSLHDDDRQRLANLAQIDQEHDAALKAVFERSRAMRHDMEMLCAFARKIETDAVAQVRDLERMESLDVRHDRVVSEMNNVQARHLLGHRLVNETLETAQREGLR